TDNNSNMARKSISDIIESGLIDIESITLRTGNPDPDNITNTQWKELREQIVRDNNKRKAEEREAIRIAKEEERKRKAEERERKEEEKEARILARELQRELDRQYAPIPHNETLALVDYCLHKYNNVSSIDEFESINSAEDEIRNLLSMRWKDDDGNVTNYPMHSIPNNIQQQFIRQWPYYVEQFKVDKQVEFLNNWLMNKSKWNGKLFMEASNRLLSNFIADEQQIEVMQMWLMMLKRNLVGVDTPYKFAAALYSGQGTGKSAFVDSINRAIKNNVGSSGRSYDQIQFISELNNQFTDMFMTRGVIDIEDWKDIPNSAIAALKNMITSSSTVERQLKYANSRVTLDRPRYSIAITCNENPLEIITRFDPTSRRIAKIDWHKGHKQFELYDVTNNDLVRVLERLLEICPIVDNSNMKKGMEAVSMYITNQSIESKAS
ncbi:MAG: hypothetical protein HUJ63_06375, partial [Enterococcus sp.]|nr:hypothetical protein [Enterococcus sp.]